jgi:hypothetical protein
MIATEITERITGHGETAGAPRFGTAACFASGLPMTAQAALESLGIECIDLQATHSRGGPGTDWVLTQAVVSAAAEACGDRRCMLFGSNAEKLAADDVQRFAESSSSTEADVLLPSFALHTTDALVSAAFLRPLTTALYGVPVQGPLPAFFSFSQGFAQRLSKPGAEAESIFWPAAEAAATRATVAETQLATQLLPTPPHQDLQSVLGSVIGSFFADAEHKAATWQRIRPRPAVVLSAPNSFAAAQPEPPGQHQDVTELIAGFRNAYTNLRDFWGLIVTPQTLLALKRATTLDDTHFEINDALWVRVVYDFLLAYHARNINQGHLLGALTPLYLAWVASRLRFQDEGASITEGRARQLNAAFEADKPYLIGRWRSPDRFNP